MRAIAKRRNDLMPTNIFDDFFGGNRMLDRMVDDLFGVSTGAPVNVIKTETGQLIEIEAPGMTKDDFSIKVDDGMLTISAQAEKKSEAANHREFYKRSFTRSFALPEGIRENEISANYDAGILKLTVPVAPVEDVKKEILTIDVT